MGKIGPGQGYRFLEPGEKVQPGDEYKDPHGGWLQASNYLYEGRQDPFPYRRKLPDPAEAVEGIARACGDIAPKDSDFLRWVADRLVHVHGDNGNADFVLRLRGIAASLPDPNAPKPFTPNKYTRYIPTLDGRAVPVDVYCVSEAFPLDKCLKSAGAVEAVLHARKKALAPGQRGQKDALQDIREAHASLGRAIALEEAALGREVQNG